MQTLQINSTLQSGKYSIKKVLGQGGFGITYLAEHELLGTKVAIKEFFMKELNNRDESTSQVSVGSEGSRELVMKFRDKFIKEARNIARLNHPNIIRIHDIFEENGTAYYVMEYCEGESLNELLKKHPEGLGEALAVKYIRQVASALQYIHERKMNHLDVKPANIMLNAGNAVLIDFGLSKQYDATGSQTSTTPVGISHGFAPIEQYKQGGVSEFSPATDIYSLGATLYKLITGQTPPDAQVLLEEELPEFISTQNVATAIRKAMQVRRSDRPQSIKEWKNIFEVSSSYRNNSVKEKTIKPYVEEESTHAETSSCQEEEQFLQEFQTQSECEGQSADSVEQTHVIETIISRKDTNAHSKTQGEVSSPNNKSPQLESKESLLFEKINNLSFYPKKYVYYGLIVLLFITISLWMLLSKTYSVTGQLNGHDYVDLGLSVNWSTKNLGAKEYSDYGSFYAWGETSARSHFDWQDYFDTNTNGDSFIKYTCSGINCIAEDSGNDAARELWGSKWRLPTVQEYEELIKKCEWKWVRINGRYGYKITSKINKNSIFLPASGSKGDEWTGKNVGGHYMTSSLFIERLESKDNRELYFNGVIGDHLISIDGSCRCLGTSIRPVFDPK